MAEVLVLVETAPDGAGVRKTTLEALTAARALGEPSAVAVVLGAPGTAAARQGRAGRVRRREGAGRRVRGHRRYLVAPKAEVLAQLVADRSPAAVVIPSTPRARRSPAAWRSRPARAS